jgi:cytochrome P450
LSLQRLNDLKLTDDNERDGMKFFYDYMSKTGFSLKSDWYLESLLVLDAASFETTSETLSAILLLLGMNPNKQEILYNELKSVLSSENDHVTEKDIDNLPYLGLVIKESLRMLPVALVSCCENILLVRHY